MNSSKTTHMRTIAWIALASALGACETMATAEQANLPAPAVASVDETTGAGKYYPAASSVESPDIRFGQMPGVGPQQRQSFVDQVNIAASMPGRTFPIVAQAVGENSDTLVFIYLSAEGPMTPYLARGVLARLTSITRSAPAIAEMGLSREFDVYNMAAVLGFARMIVTDGRAFAHQANLEKN